MHGKIKLELKDKKSKEVKYLSPGSIYTIKPGVIHKFSCLSKKGSVIEELSSTHNKTDSYYVDNKINKNKDRKTFISLN